MTQREYKREQKAFLETKFSCERCNKKTTYKDLHTRIIDKVGGEKGELEVRMLCPDCYDIEIAEEKTTENLKRAIKVLNENQHLHIRWVYDEQGQDGICRYCVMGLLAKEFPEMGISLVDDNSLIVAEPIIREAFGLNDEFSVLELVTRNDHSKEGNYNDAIDYLRICAEGGQGD